MVPRLNTLVNDAWQASLETGHNIDLSVPLSAVGQALAENHEQARRLILEVGFLWAQRVALDFDTGVLEATPEENYAAFLKGEGIYLPPDESGAYDDVHAWMPWKFEGETIPRNPGIAISKLTSWFDVYWQGSGYNVHYVHSLLVTAFWAYANYIYTRQQEPDFMLDLLAKHGSDVHRTLAVQLERGNPNLTPDILLDLLGQPATLAKALLNEVLERRPSLRALIESTEVVRTVLPDGVMLTSSNAKVVDDLRDRLAQLKEPPSPRATFPTAAEETFAELFKAWQRQESYSVIQCLKTLLALLETP